MHVGFVDLIVAVFAVLAVVVTLILAIIGFKAAGEFTANAQRLRRIEAFLKQEKEARYGINNLTEVSFETFVNIIGLVDIQRRKIEDILEANQAPPSSAGKSETEMFRDAVSGPLEKVLRMSLYFQVMASKGGEELDFVNSLVAHYPDFATVDFLKALSQTRVEQPRELLLKRALELEASLREAQKEATARRSR